MAAATLEQVEEALRNAHASGDTTRAGKLARLYRDMQAGTVPSPAESREPSREERLAAARKREADEARFTQSLNPAAELSGAQASALGVPSAIVSTGRGVRQAFNRLIGDEATLARLNEEEAEQRAQDERLSAASGGAFDFTRGFTQLGGAAIPAGAVGKVAPALGAIPAASRAATAFTNSPRVVQALARLGIGSVGGAAQGAGTVSLTPEEEAGSGRGSAALFGAGVWGAIPVTTAALSGARETLRRAGRELPEEAKRSLARMLGWADDFEQGAAAAGMRSATEDEFQRLKQDARTRYATIEQNPELPPITFSDEARAMLREGVQNLPAEVVMQSSPVVSRFVRTISEGGGQPHSFGEVRELKRQLRSAKRKAYNTDPNAAMALDSMDKLLDQELDTWASQTGRTFDATALEGPAGAAPAPSTVASPRDALLAARGVDADYQRDVVPFYEGTLGSFRGTGKVRGQYPTGRETYYLKPSASADVEELVTRVPEARAPLQQLMGEEIARPGMTADRLYRMPIGAATDQATARRARLVAEALAGERRNPPGFLRHVPGDFVERIMHGVEDIGYTPRNPATMADDAALQIFLNNPNYAQ